MIKSNIDKKKKISTVNYRTIFTEIDMCELFIWIAANNCEVQHKKILLAATKFKLKYSMRAIYFASFNKKKEKEKDGIRTRTPSQ